MKLLAGNSNRTLAEAVASHLDLPLTRAQVKRFSDNEIFVAIEEKVRGEDIFVIQSTSYPANDNLMELLICIDALRRAKSGGFVSDRPVELSVYGLEPAGATIEVDSAGTRRALLIGDVVSLGAQDRFGMLDGTTTVVRLPAAVLAPMIPRLERLIDAVASGVRARDIASEAIEQGEIIGA
jgi:hypothetical protein